MSIRNRLTGALAGDPVEWPVYAVYDWFVENRTLDWQVLFDQGLGRLNHANLLRIEHPHLEVRVEEREQDGRTRKEVRWITEQGELSEWYLDAWRQEYLVKSPEDYRILEQAFTDLQVTPTDEFFHKSEYELGANGITLGQFGCVPRESRTPLQRIQIDFAGPERIAVDLACESPELRDLLELMNEQLYGMFRGTLQSSAEYIKLWENLEIGMMGPPFYRQHLTPVYQRIFDILEGSGKKLIVHYDGKLSSIAEDIRVLPFDGLDSLTPPPEGDIPIAEARALWPDKFFWLHPSLGWFTEDEATLRAKVRNLVKDAGPTRFCLQLSEEVPTEALTTVPIVLDVLQGG